MGEGAFMRNLECRLRRLEIVIVGERLHDKAVQRR